MSTNVFISEVPLDQGAFHHHIVFFWPEGFISTNNNNDTVGTLYNKFDRMKISLNSYF
jgi:hypothetical protein